MQERQSPRSASEQLVSTERRALARGRRLHGLVAGAGAALLALFAVGCPEPGDLENPGYYCKPGQSIVTNGVVTGCNDTPAAAGTGGMATGGTGGGAPAGSSCTTDCVKRLFQTDNTNCALCHGKAAQSAKLDLQSPGAAARLKDIAATHAEVTDTTGCGQGDKLVDSATPANSWLLKKVNGMHGSCGAAMPVGPALPAEDVTCIETYVKCVAMGGT